MTILTDLAADIAHVFDTDGLAQSMLYTSSSGSTATVNALSQGIEAYSKQIDPMLADHSTFYVLISALTAASITPDLYDTLSDGVNTWRVEQIKVNAGGLYVLLCSKHQRKG